MLINSLQNCAVTPVQHYSKIVSFFFTTWCLILCFVNNTPPTVKHVGQFFPGVLVITRTREENSAV